jgi:hypothetical protein
MFNKYGTSAFWLEKEYNKEFLKNFYKFGNHQDTPNFIK